ncbi:MAG: hypothetical protein HC902_04690 [Calothrix sp. SM1_5_4]|nr:hypothetical protein [Calothrix sp. SM1_5_4]
MNAIDFVGPGKSEFLKFAEGRVVKLSGDKKTAVVWDGVVKPFGHDTRYKVVSFLTDPEFAYLLLMGSLALLYFEFTHPGSIFPGIAGGVGLVVAMVALHKLDVEWGGLMLIFLGIGLLIAELFIPAFGLVGAGGIVSFLLGSLFLFDPVKSGGYRLPLGVILPVVVVFALVFVVVSILVLRTARVRKRGGAEELLGQRALVVRLDEGSVTGMAEAQGELWKFHARTPVSLNEHVIVRGYEGLVLAVEKEIKRERERKEET